MSLNFIIGWDNEKWYNKRVLIWRFPLVFMKSYAEKSIVIAEIKWQSNTGQSVLKSKGLYRTGGHSTGLVRRYFVFTGICNHQYLSLLTLWVWTPRGRGILDTTLCDKVCLWLAAGQWFSPVSSTNKPGRHDIAEILLKMTLNTITLTFWN